MTDYLKRQIEIIRAAIADAPLSPKTRKECGPAIDALESECESARTVDRAMGIIHCDYQDDINGIVADLRTEIAGGHLEDSEAIDTWLHETIDGHQRVIYTFRAKLGLLASSNEDAYQAELGEPAPTVESACYMAMMADVREHSGYPDDEWVAWFGFERHADLYAYAETVNDATGTVPAELADVIASILLDGPDVADMDDQYIAEDLHPLRAEYLQAWCEKHAGPGNAFTIGEEY